MINDMKFRRRELMKVGAAGAGVLALGRVASMTIQPIAERLSLSALTTAQAESVYIEAFPTSPLILDPFTQALKLGEGIPNLQRPVPYSEYSNWASPPKKDAQDSNGGTHQYWPGEWVTLPDGKTKVQLPYQDTDGSGNPMPLVYEIPLQVGQARVTDNRVLPINKDGQKITPPASAGVTLNPDGTTYLPKSTIWGFNGGFPGARINAEYGRPVLIRFKNELSDGIVAHPTWKQYDYGSGKDDRDPGAPGFLIHLHNGHTAPESDGNPNYRANQKDWGAGGEKKHREGGYVGAEIENGKIKDGDSGDWVDNLYLNWAAGNDDSQKQSFFWFHDHYHNHTGADVYKGMVGLFPIYDPKNSMDMGDETKGYHLPGVRKDNGDGSFEVDYDIPFALYDVRLDDGATPHKDFHVGTGETHPELWGHKFFKHFPNHGFVGDIFTVNGIAYPVMQVERRRYRLRFLDASISRIYNLQLMNSKAGPKPAKDLGYKDTELQGQYRLPDGKQCMRFMQVASEGGLLPRSIPRDSFELWPAKRREFVVDFTHYMDGTTTKDGDEIYLVNTAKMPDGRMPTSTDPNYKVPVMKFKLVAPTRADNSAEVWDWTKGGAPKTLNLRPLAAVPSDILNTSKYKRRTFTLERGSAGGETEWLINGKPFDPTLDLADPKRNTWEVWEIKNGGGGWVHPMHLHMEEHRILSRNGKAVDYNSNDAENIGREDVVALGPSESVVVARQFRTFTGKYVAHCHNLAHEDHNMMFGWRIEP